MIKLKFRKINKLNIAKAIFSFISDSVKSESLYGDVDFPPLHEIYDIMIDNVQNKSNLQFYGDVYNVLMGIVIASESTIYPNCVMVNVLCVIKKYRKNGFAQDMLSEIERIAKKRKAKKIRMAFSKSGRAFCEKNGYKLHFEISYPAGKHEEVLSLVKDLPIEQIDLKTVGKENYMLFSVKTPSLKTASIITDNIKNSTAKFIYEKEL